VILVAYSSDIRRGRDPNIRRCPCCCRDGSDHIIFLARVSMPHICIFRGALWALA